MRPATRVSNGRRGVETEKDGPRRDERQGQADKRSHPPDR